MHQEPSAGRRSFLLRAVLAAQAVLGLTLSTAGLGYLLTPLVRRGSKSDWVPLPASPPAKGDPPRRVEFIVREADGYVVRSRSHGAWIVADPGTGQAVVFSGECTHLGCNFDWSSADGAFVCPCHGGRFDAAGRNVSGPPRRPLDRYPVMDKGGVLFIKPEKERA